MAQYPNELDDEVREDRDEVVEPIVCQGKAARMLGEMARCAGKLRREFEGQAQPAIAEIEVEFAGALLIYRLAMQL